VKHTRCAICLDPRRHDIESELADGARLRASARKHGVSYDCLWRHWRNHLSAEQKDRLRFGDAPAHKLKGMVAEEGISVLRDLNFTRKSLIDALTVAPAQDANARAVLAGRMHENARIRGSITGELARSPLVTQNTLNVFIDSPEFVTFQAALMDALAPYPAAREAVVAQFERLEAEETAELRLPALEHEPDAA
jgi:hypothetical protein